MGQSKKWITHDTGINAVSLKFDATPKYAIVAIDIDTKNIEDQDRYFSKFISLKTLLEESFPSPLIWEEDFQLENDKYISRIYTEIKEVSIYNKESWPEIFNFFFTNMIALEEFYLDYIDVIKKD
jgi:hypothetical protein